MAHPCVLLVVTCVLGSTIASPKLGPADEGLHSTIMQANGIDIESVIGNWLTYHGPFGLYKKILINLSKIRSNELITYKGQLSFSAPNITDIDWTKVSLYGLAKSSSEMYQFLVENLDEKRIRLIPMNGLYLEINIFTVELVNETLFLSNCSRGIEIDLLKNKHFGDEITHCGSYYHNPLFDLIEKIGKENKSDSVVEKKTFDQILDHKTENSSTKEDEWIKVNLHIENGPNGISYEKEIASDDMGEFDPLNLMPLQSALEHFNISFMPKTRETNTNLSDTLEQLYDHITDARYDEAVYLSKILENSKKGAVIADIVRRLVNGGSRNIMGYAYKLWVGEAKQIVNNHFPESFKLIFSQNDVRIINQKYLLPLKLDSIHYYGDRLALGDGARRCQPDSFKWKLIPVWSNGEIIFKIMNLRHNNYLKLDVKHDDIGDRLAWGAANSEENRYNWALEPVRVDENILFYIINREYNQGLKLEMRTDGFGDRNLWGHNGYVYGDPQRFGWSIKTWM